MQRIAEFEKVTYDIPDRGGKRSIKRGDPAKKIGLANASPMTISSRKRRPLI